MSLLRPKYELGNGAQGSRTTIPAEEFTRLTGQRYPYPRLGTRAPNSNPGTIQPKYTTDSMASPASSGTVTAGRFIPGPLTPKYMAGDGNPVIAPHYVLDRAEVQGVMPAETYMRLYGRLTTQPELPPRYPSAPVVRAPSLAFDWGTFFWGAVGGGIVTLLMVYGVIPALSEWAAFEVRKKYIPPPPPPKK